jgi:hypothetical protein
MERWWFEQLLGNIFFSFKNDELTDATINANIYIIEFQKIDLQCTHILNVMITATLWRKL